MSDQESSGDAFVYHLMSRNMVTLTINYRIYEFDDTTSASSAAETPTTSTCSTPTPRNRSEGAIENEFIIVIHASLLASLTPLVSDEKPQDLVFESDEHDDISAPGLKALAEFAYRGTYTTKSLLQDMQVWATASALHVTTLMVMARERINSLEEAKVEEVREVVEYAFLVLRGQSPTGGDDELFQWLAGITAWRLDELKNLDATWLDGIVENSPIFARLLLKHMQPATRPPGNPKTFCNQSHQTWGEREAARFGIPFIYRRFGARAKAMESQLPEVGTEFHEDKSPTGNYPHNLFACHHCDKGFIFQEELNAHTAEKHNLFQRPPRSVRAIRIVDPTTGTTTVFPPDRSGKKSKS